MSEQVVTLPPDPTSAAIARSFVVAEFRRIGCGELSDSAELGVSELVTNAGLHARTPCRVWIEMRGGQPRIMVADTSPLLPSPRQHDAGAVTGRGLRLLSGFGRWGSDPTPEGKVVWFEPFVQPYEIEHASVEDWLADAFDD